MTRAHAGHANASRDAGAAGTGEGTDGGTGAPPRDLRAAGHTLALGGEPWLMGIVNASPDSFSDPGLDATLEQRFERAAALLDAGARIIDVGGESAVTNRPAVDAREEIARVAPLVQRIAGELGAVVSVDTYKPAVAEAAIAAGAAIVNDVSGLLDPALAEVCARSGAGLVLMHTRDRPKTKRLDPGRYAPAGVRADVSAFLRARIALALERGVAVEQIMLDPGPDFSKTPQQTVEALRGLEELHELGRPLLLAASRKDFIGAVVGRRPRERLAGTLAAIGWGADRGAHVMRVHDVAAAADYLAVRAVLRGEARIPASDRDALRDELRWEPAPRAAG